MTTTSPTTDILHDMGARIRYVRLERRVTQAALVLKTNLPIAAIERGTCDITVRALCTIAEVLECRVCELLPGGAA